MPETIIADASCLVVLANIDRLDLLHAVYGRVITTPEIAAEFKMELPEWLTVTAPVDRRMIEQINQDIDLG